MDGERRFDVTVRLPPATREDVGAIASMGLPLKGGSLLPLSAIARISMARAARPSRAKWAALRWRARMNVRNPRSRLLRRGGARQR